MQLRKINALLAAFTVSAIFSLSAFALLSPAVNAAARDALCGGASVDLTTLDSDSGVDKDTCKDADPCERADKDGKCLETESESKVNGLLTNIINIISVIAGILGVIFIIIGGLKYITSGGDSGKVSAAKSTIFAALIGLIVVALAQFVVRFIISKAN